MTAAGASPSTRPVGARLRWQLQLALGLLCATLGGALTMRPFTSLAVLVAFVAASFATTGVSELARAQDAAVPPLARAAGVGWIGAGIVVIAWAGITIHALAVVVGISMLVGGSARCIGALRATIDDRVLAALTGVAGAVFGVLALSWPDVTVLVVALLVGPRTVLFGVGEAAAALRARRAGVGRRRAVPRWLRLLGAGAALLLAFGLLAVSAVIHRSKAVPDAFYAAPANVPPAPGRLVREQAYTHDLPSGWRAWRILYTTTREAGVPAVASAVVIALQRPPPGQRPVIAWAHGTTGIAPRCAPSLLPSRWTPDVIPGLTQMMARDWVLVATDYVGLGTVGPHPYLIGEGQARSVLDSVRAARQMPELSLSNRTVVWGHSQGGHAALWAGIIAPTYAPDLDVVGVAALAPASDLLALVKEVKDTVEGKIIASYVITAYSQAYPDVSFDRYVRPAARVIVRETARRCLDVPEAIPSVVTKALANEPIYAADPLAGALGRRLAQNVPTGAIRAPVLIAQGLWDPLVLPSMQAQFFGERCAAGASIQYRTYAQRDHLSLVARASPLIPDLVSWTAARLAGRRTVPASGCRTASG